MASFEGKVALVTGGGGGIGRATSVLFGKNGARVVVADIDEATGEAAARAVAESGGEAIFVKTDVTSPPEVEALVKRTVDTFGRLDCAFNNAGVSRHQVPGGIAGWDEMVGVNLRGVMLCMRYEIPQMLQRGAGAIVNTSSVNALVTTRPSPVRPRRLPLKAPR